MSELAKRKCGQPLSRNGLYARRLGITLRSVLRIGGRNKMKAMHPFARKILIRSILREREARKAA